MNGFYMHTNVYEDGERNGKCTTAHNPYKEIFCAGVIEIYNSENLDKEQKDDILKNSTYATHEHFDEALNGKYSNPETATKKFTKAERFRNIDANDRILNSSDKYYSDNGLVTDGNGNYLQADTDIQFLVAQHDPDTQSSIVLSATSSNATKTIYHNDGTYTELPSGDEYNDVSITTLNDGDVLEIKSTKGTSLQVSYLSEYNEK